MPANRLIAGLWHSGRNGGFIMKLEFNSVIKNYGKKLAVNGLSIVFEPGIYGLFGPNGAGNTTVVIVAN